MRRPLAELPGEMPSPLAPPSGWCSGHGADMLSRRARRSNRSSVEVAPGHSKASSGMIFCEEWGADIRHTAHCTALSPRRLPRRRVVSVELSALPRERALNAMWPCILANSGSHCRCPGEHLHSSDGETAWKDRHGRRADYFRSPPICDDRLTAGNGEGFDPMPDTQDRLQMNAT